MNRTEKLLLPAVPSMVVSLSQYALRQSVSMWIAIVRRARNAFPSRRGWSRGLAIGFSAAVLLLVYCGGAAYAQGIITGGISGTVVDQTGAVVPGAIVKAVSETTGASFQVVTSGEGLLQIPDVPLGAYTVTITASGFGSDVVSHVHVVAGNITSIGKQSLSLGTAAQTVNVEADAAQLINTESSQGEVIVDTAQLQTLPVNGAFDNVTLMVPGVVQTHSDSMSNTNGANFSVNGERGRANNSEVDGQSNNDNSIGGPSFFFSNQDSLQEIQVITTDFGAQYGRNMGAVVNYITKQGTNSFHGTGFEYYTGSFLSSLLQYQKDPQFGFCPPGVNPSTGCTAVTVPRFVQNNYGGTLGGPILKDKLFFFGSTFWGHEYQAGAIDTSGGSIFPDANGLKQLQAAYPNNPGVAAMVMNGPYSVSQGNPAPVPGTTQTVPVTDGNTIANIEMAGVERTLAAHVLDQEELGRLDYQMTPKDRIYLRYDYQNNPWIPAWYLYFNYGIASGGYSQVSGITHQTGGDWTHTFTPRVVNQLRYAFQQSAIGFETGTLPSCTVTNFTSCSSIVTIGGGGAGFGYGYGSLIAPNFPQGRVIKVNQVQDNGSWNHGRHTITFGGEFDHQDSPNAWLPFAEGQFNFTPVAANPLRNVSSNSALSNGFTGMLEGVGTLQLAQGSPTIPFREPDYALYFQDDWKALQNLTINLGLRYEFFSQSVNLLHNESVAQQTSSHPFWNTSLPLSATTVPKVNSSFRNIQPRIGLAYTPGFARKIVVHAGFAMNVDPEFYNIFLDMGGAAPVVNSGIVNCDGITVNCEPANGFTFATVQAADDKLLPTGGDPRINPTQTVPTNLRNPMAETYTLGVQYQLFPAAVMEVRYVGNHTFDQFQSLNTNPDILDVQGAFPGYGSGTSPCTNPNATGYTRPSCNNFLVDTIGNTAFSNYNALQTSFTLRDFHHLTGTASYTYSRTIDNVSEIISTGAGGTTSAFAQNPLNSNVGERGVSGNSYPSVWGIQMTYNAPWFTHQPGILGRALGGYFLNAFYQFNGGQPFNAIQNAYAVQSSNVLSDIAGTPQNSGGITPAVAANINQTQAETSFCDANFAANFGNSCRPILSNPRAPLSSIGINLGPGGYVDYVTGSPTTPSTEHWLWNNQYEAIARNNPFPGVGRNTLRGDSFNNLDLTVGKNVKVTERVNMLFQVSAFNVLNRAYYGTPDPNMEDSAFGGFLSSVYAYNTSSGSSAAGGAYEQGFGNRNVQLGAKIVF